MSAAGLLSALFLAAAQQRPGGIEEFEGADEAPPPIATRAFGSLRVRGGVDTRFDPPEVGAFAEDVVEARAHGRIGAEARLDERARLFLEARLTARTRAQRAGPARMDLGLELGEAYVDVYTPAVDLRAGSQYIPLGANPLFAPADRLNAWDLRWASLLEDPDVLRVPAIGVRALGTVERVTWTAAWVPVFRGSRLSLARGDEGLLRPALARASPPIQSPSPLERLDGALAASGEVERAAGVPWLGDVAVRLTAPVGPVTLGASWIWAAETFPTAAISPELRDALEAALEAGPVDEGAVQAALDEGRLLVGRYRRAHLFSVEARALAAGAQLDVDVGYSPSQLAFDGFDPVRAPGVRWAVGVSQASESDLVYAFTWVGAAARGFGAHAFIAAAAWRGLDDRVELGLRAAGEPMRGSWAVAPRVAWTALPRVTLGLGAELFGGPFWSPFGYFGGNDRVVGEVAVSLP